MKKTTLFLALVFATGSLLAQKKITSSAVIAIDATTPKDDLPKATNNTVIGSLDTQTGAVAFEAAVKNFTFSNPTMQEHFNGKYWLDSDTYPVLSFSGMINDIGHVHFNKNGVYKVKVEGQMKIKNISQKEKMDVSITVINGKIKAASAFQLELADYGITATPIKSGKVAKKPSITVAAEF